jgi:PEP-CTERM putative exosortase interaction domain
VRFESALALIVCLIAVPAAHAGDWTGYMNVFNNDGGSQGTFVFGQSWGVADLKTTVNTSNPGTIIGDNLTLEPNYNTYADNPGDAFWRDNGGAGPGGNKWMEANTIFEVNPIGVLEYALTGTVDANTLDSGYTAEAFVKVLDSGSFVTLLNDRVTLPTSGTFAITSDLTFYQGQILQTGFTISGLNANPADAATLGSVTVTVTQPVPEPGTIGLATIGLIGSLGYTAIRRRRKAGTVDATIAA